MEYLNRIELRGKIGHVKTNIIGEIKVTNFSLVTECMTQSNLTGIPVECYVCDFVFHRNLII